MKKIIIVMLVLSVVACKNSSEKNAAKSNQSCFPLDERPHACYDNCDFIEGNDTCGWGKRCMPVAKAAGSSVDWPVTVGDQIALNDVPGVCVTK